MTTDIHERVDALEQDVANLRELERAAWLALESRVRPLEERRDVVQNMYVLIAQRAIVDRVNAERERDLARADSDRLEARCRELEDCVAELRARNDDHAPAPVGAAAAGEQKDMARAMRLLRAELASNGELDGVYASSVIEQAVELIQSLRATVGPNRHLIDHLKAENDRVEADVHAACALLEEIRSDLGGLYGDLELPAAVREMLASSRGIRDQRIKELERANEMRADRLAAVHRVLDANTMTRADDEFGMRVMYGDLRRALSGEAP